MHSSILDCRSSLLKFGLLFRSIVLSGSSRVLNELLTVALSRHFYEIIRKQTLLTLGVVTKCKVSLLNLDFLLITLIFGHINTLDCLSAELGSHPSLHISLYKFALVSLMLE